MDKKISLSICVPAFNEEDSLSDSVKGLANILLDHLRNFELIIVDDGSSDLTFDIADKISKVYDYVKVIKHERNLGIGACFKDALKIANYEYFGWFPADNENDAAELLNCLPYLDSNTVVTSHHLGCDPRSFSRRLLSRVYTLFYNIVFGLNIKYYNGLTIFPLTKLRCLNLQSSGFGIFAESIIKSLKAGLDIKELLNPLYRRSCGSSKSLTLISFLRIVKDLRWIFKDY